MCPDQITASRKLCGGLFFVYAMNRARSNDDAETFECNAEHCFALMESPVHGGVIRSRPSKHLIDLVICDWIASGGPEVLRAAKPDVPLEDHWITIPRSILKRHDVTLPGVGSFKIVAMHLQVISIVNKHLGVSSFG